MKFGTRLGAILGQIAGFKLIPQDAEPADDTSSVQIFDLPTADDNVSTGPLLKDKSGILHPLVTGADSCGVVQIEFGDSPFQVLPHHRKVLVDTTGGAVTCLLPAPGDIQPGTSIEFVDQSRNFAVANLTIDGGVPNINGAGTLVRSAIDGGVTLTWGGVTWEYETAAAGGAVTPSGITFTQTYATADGTIAALTTTALTDNGGGIADGTVASMAAPTTLTDSTGLSGTHDDTLAATAAPAALTEGAGAIGGTSDGDLPALVDPAGDAGASVIAGIREVATRCNTLGTLAGVLAQNESDIAQKIIEMVTLLTTIQNNFKEVTTQIAALQADVLAMKKNDNRMVDAMQAGGLAG